MKISYYYFDQIFPVEQQSQIATRQFEILRDKFRQEQLTLGERGFRNVGPGGRKYFDTRRKFGRLVPQFYKRTEAPRLSVPGNTFHGMKKNLLLSILSVMSLEKDVVFIDIDMSAAHSRIARYLLRDPDSIMGLSLKDENFWETQISLLEGIYKDKGFSVPSKIIKKILKVGLYTSLNGGNPLSDERIENNLTVNAEGYMNSIGLDQTNFKYSSFWDATHEILANFQLIV